MGSKKHEARDINVATLAWLGLGVAVVTVVVAGVVLLLFRGIVAREVDRREPASPFAATPTGHAEPMLQVDPPEEVQAVNARERETLTSYGWVDRDAGIVRLPIERAITLLIERGRPARAEASDAGAAPPEEAP